MILIADSGATKTDWGFCGKNIFKDGSDSMTVQSEGINASTMHPGDILRIIRSVSDQTGEEVAGQVSEIHFYGAGIVSEQSAIALRAAMLDVFPNAYLLEFSSDLAGAAKALFGNGTGVAAILGTGSNSCLFENGMITRNIRSGGFILGDEGGGAALGRMLLADYFKELVPEDFAADFENEFHITYPAAVAEIYKGDTPSRYLASFAKFVIEHREHGYAASLIEKNLRDFIERSLDRYGCREVGVIGSLGCACREELIRLGHEYGLEFVRFLPSPIESLIAFHSGQSI